MKDVVKEIVLGIGLVVFMAIWFYLGHFGFIGKAVGAMAGISYIAYWAYASKIAAKLINDLKD